MQELLLLKTIKLLKQISISTLRVSSRHLHRWIKLGNNTLMLNVQILIPLSNNLATPFSTQRASVLQDSTQTKAYTINVMVLLVNPPVPLRFLHPHQQRQSTNNSSKKYNTLHRVRDNIRNLNHLKLFKYKIAKSRVSKIFLDQKRLCIS